jgi:uncharacterized surface protein with fasciclin (FAS1) repeats
MKRSLVLAAVAGLALATAACGGSSSGSASGPAASTASTAPAGRGCAGLGSADGMAKEPLAAAASNNPQLTTLVAAVTGKLNPQVNLVDTLDSGQFTVFAPVDAAFARMPAATMNSLKTDAGLLTKFLTYHALPTRLSPDKVIGEQRTVEGSTVTVAGTPDNLTVNGASVLCGGVQTANATVYLIDDVLTPPS